MNYMYLHMSDRIAEKMEGYLIQNTQSYFNESGIRNDGVWATDAEILGILL